MELDCLLSRTYSCIKRYKFSIRIGSLRMSTGNLAAINDDIRQANRHGGPPNQARNPRRNKYFVAPEQNKRKDTEAQLKAPTPDNSQSTDTERLLSWRCFVETMGA